MNGNLYVYHMHAKDVREWVFGNSFFICYNRISMDYLSQKIIITGASGYVGARLFLDLSKDFETIGTYHSTQLSQKFEKLDITNGEEVMDFVRAHRPDVIVHAAAEASSKSCDADPQKAIAINQKGTEGIVNAADSVGALVVYISATVAELQNSMYEKTKFSAENAVRAARSGFVILRPSVVFGMSPNTTTDKPFNHILNDSKRKGKHTYDTSWKFQPTWLAHLSETVSDIANRKLKNIETAVVVDQMKSKYDIAHDILSKFRVKAQAVDEKSWRPSTPVSTAELARLGLPMHTYDEMIEGIVKEIKDKNRYMF